MKVWGLLALFFTGGGALAPAAQDNQTRRIERTKQTAKTSKT